MTSAEHVAVVEAAARTLAAALKQAEAAGVGYALILPALVAVFREEGMLAELPFPIPGVA